MPSPQPVNSATLTFTTVNATTAQSFSAVTYSPTVVVENALSVPVLAATDGTAATSSETAHRQPRPQTRRERFMWGRQD